ncbi:MAG TPA: tetratricopeptide repeat protein [Gallionella sp.]|nr:tetratricopeptide repeat protein [Gallionella sp.]
MSLLLDARKKSLRAQHAQAAERASDAIEAAAPTARDAGRNLFAAKTASAGFALPSRGLMIALAATILLLAAGLGYLWRLDSQSGDLVPLHPMPPHIALSSPALTGSSSTPANRSEAALPGGDMPQADQPAAVAGAMERQAPQRDEQNPPHAVNPVRVEHQRTETIDPLLERAYLTYRVGNLEEAQQLYQTMLAKDTRNADAQLGLAAIAQQRGENMLAAHYYASVLTLDPRNAVANAGMSALGADNEGDENRLRALLREQNNSAALHFALGNLLIAQSRWGEAQQAYFNAYTLEPDNAEIAYNLAVSLDHLGQSKLAAQYYQRALQLDTADNSSFDHALVARRIERLGQPGK